MTTPDQLKELVRRLDDLGAPTTDSPNAWDELVSEMRAAIDSLCLTAPAAAPAAKDRYPTMPEQTREALEAWAAFPAATAVPPEPVAFEPYVEDYERVAKWLDKISTEYPRDSFDLRMASTLMREAPKLFASPPSPVPAEPPASSMNEEELQEFCISLSFEQDDYTVEVIQAVENRMRGISNFVPRRGASVDAARDALKGDVT